MLTSFDVGRTFRTSILKLGVSRIAAISKTNVIWTEVCMVAAVAVWAAAAVSIDTVWAARQNGSRRREEHSVVKRQTW